MVRGARGGDEEVGGAEGGAGVSVLLFFSLSLIRRGARAHTPHPRGKFGGGVYFLFFFPSERVEMGMERVVAGGGTRPRGDTYRIFERAADGC